MKRKAKKKTAGAKNCQIVVLQRGWVVVGDFSQNGESCFVRNGYVVRKWGTTKGLGELAENGPLSETVLDEIPETKFHQLTIVAQMTCSDVWKKLCAKR